MTVFILSLEDSLVYFFYFDVFNLSIKPYLKKFQVSSYEKVFVI